MLKKATPTIKKFQFIKSGKFTIKLPNIIIIPINSKNFDK